MSRNVLEAFPVAAHSPLHLLDALEEAMSGQRSLLPVPLHDLARARALAHTMRAGNEIDADIAVVMATSGSTGTPKGAQLTAVNLVASADATHQALGGVGNWLLALPAHHIAGLQVLTRSLVAGYEPLWIDVSQGFDIAKFAPAAQQLRDESSRCYTALTPMQLLKAMDTLQGIEALQCFDAILVGGGPLRAEDQRAAQALNISVVTTYGSSETAGGCVYDGKPLPGTTIRIENEQIILGGPTIAHGYRNLPNHEAFAEPGVYRTSDTGVLHQGRLTLTGRLDTIIDSGGLKLHPEVLERVIETTPGVVEVVVVGKPDPRLGHAIVAAYTGTATPADIIEALDELPRWQLPKMVKKVAALPKTALGKIDRAKAAALFEEIS
ncbi:o-succinylbenzoate--CoA ligase [Corynebacterium sp. HS2168-gen11]|uniref:o-succinylbenzoate--CoA ligase n=1 Tax=Corynebacterium sp. HS2168-gen11 TaxID=2974027 RepID=UPI00216B38BD|nr:o-succinylbenzoate--CoA ligase [Corynebacterium sp. HS2168-gen11]MCS4535751.1 o-succinylbenzoate--CoA ligase [Corynebacterium sp. HS2168-gen11]